MFQKSTSLKDFEYSAVTYRAKTQSSIFYHIFQFFWLLDSNRCNFLEKECRALSLILRSSNTSARRRRSTRAANPKHRYPTILGGDSTINRLSPGSYILLPFSVSTTETSAAGAVPAITLHFFTCIKVYFKDILTSLWQVTCSSFSRCCLDVKVKKEVQKVLGSATACV